MRTVHVKNHRTIRCIEFRVTDAAPQKDLNIDIESAIEKKEHSPGMMADARRQLTNISSSRYIQERNNCIEIKISVPVTPLLECRVVEKRPFKGSQIESNSIKRSKV